MGNLQGKSVEAPGVEPGTRAFLQTVRSRAFIFQHRVTTPFCPYPPVPSRTPEDPPWERSLGTLAAPSNSRHRNHGPRSSRPSSAFRRQARS